MVILPGGAAILVPPACADDAAGRADQQADQQRSSGPQTVAADALPTVQIDGVVWDQAIVGGTVYAVGQFTTARPAGSPPGQDEAPRSNALAYDIATGELKDWAPQVDGAIRSIDAAKDGATVYLGGDFTSINGDRTWRVGAVSTADASRQALEASANGTVHALEVSADGSTLYLGGAFTEINGLDRRRVAAVDLGAQRVTDFAPQVDDMAVRALTTARDGSAVAIGGSFTSVGGQARPGLAVLDPSGAPRRAKVNEVITAGGTESAVMGMASDDRGFYAVSYSMSGSFEGMVRAEWSDGEVRLMADCHGDSYDVHPSGEVVYVASHAHDCSMIGGFPEQQQYWHAPAFSSEPVGEVGPSPVPGYTSHTGQPAAASLHFHPVFTPGSFTGMAQATWTVEGTDKYVVYGGEFTAVNGTPQQGLVRFARRDVAPNQEGPVDKGAAYRVSATSTEPGVVRLSIPANHDRDDKHLTYAVYRDPGPMGDLEALKAQQPVWTTEQDLPFWETTTYEVRDEVGAGSTHSYVVVVWDSWGAWTRSERVTVEAQGPPPGGEGDQGPQEEGGPPADDSGRQEQG
ncbi:hypothetical protein [Actinomyces bowdenii]|uniref:Fibronectin type III domain-containing protein n=1 Tax=Actinomyces bowdenii TaxID=131109 RepID=A0A853EJX2_9ACTO|nr:hypothetical protein [Actinomyces bowdenii]MBF0697405.1 hypothetical protein [Actinomyces bowdenii]NYS69578.1 hypothetical protein [Actinomyces bowdenii]